MSAALKTEGQLTDLRETTKGTDHRALRFLTAGSVDDGKSTLIGRLLYDSRAILADQMGALEKRAAGAPVDLSLLTDGLEARMAWLSYSRRPISVLLPSSTLPAVRKRKAR